MSINLTYVIYGAMAVSIALMQFNKSAASPIVALVNRWLRWGIFALGTALLVEYFELSDQPLWLLTLVFALLWFLIETLYNWYIIKALSASPLPLFPRYSINEYGEQWPTHPRFLKVREWLRVQGFAAVQALRAEITNEIYLRVSVYQDARAEKRLQITFIPQPAGAVSMCASISTLTASGLRYVTDNMYMPFAGFYPENWMLERKPWRRSLESLMKRHDARLRKISEALAPWTNEPVADLNSQQTEIEQVNTELGFLVPYREREEYGKVTSAGLYRVWKEIWFLKYFGISAKYD